MMTSRERVVRTLSFRSPDRVPLWPRCEGTAWRHHGKALYDLLKQYPIDMGRPVERAMVAREEPLVWTDEWNCTWHRERPGYFGTVFQHPLADRAALDRYTFPDFSDARYDAHFATIEQSLAAADADVYTFAEGVKEYGVLWYRMWWLRGMDQALEDTAAGDGFIETLRDRIIETQLRYLQRVLAMKVDGVAFGDDWGTQTGLMIAPDRWRELFKPAYRRLFDAVHAAGKQVIMETDGCTRAIIGDWREIGVDLLSVQLNVVGLDHAAGHRGQTCFYADPDRQEVLPHGTPDMVDEHVRTICNALKAPTGGLVGCLYITDETPLANVKAALDAFLKYGAYGANP